MPDPFKSDYSGSPLTPQANKNQTPSLNSDSTKSTVGTTASATDFNHQPANFGFKPEFYGTGKPRRIIVRGKISID